MSQDFEQVLSAAQANGLLNPAWKKFVHTKFFVPVVRPPGSDAANISLHLSDTAGATGQSILISEVRERVERHHGSAIDSLSGADVVRMLHAEAGILVALSDRSFAIARDRVEWLRKGIEASLARAAAAARDSAATLAPAPVVPAQPAPAAVRQQAGAPLDIAALKPRNVTIAGIGLAFFVPADWRQSSMPRGLRFHADSSGSVLEASGLRRPDVSLNQWVGMRLALVRHEMRYLKQDGEPYDIDGAEWGDRVKGKAIEFTGTFPGDESESRYLVACIRIDGTVCAITIRAPVAAFEQNRALYQWFLSRVDIVAAPAGVYGTPASTGGSAAASQQQDAPGVFGLSMEGRIGRLRALAYALPVFLPLILIAVLAPVIAPKGQFAAFAAILAGAVIAMFFCVRLMVLRLHDVNISGKWLFWFILAIALGAAAGQKNFVSVASAIFWFGSMMIYCVIAGTGGDNDFGEVPGPDSNVIKFWAGLFIVLQIIGMGRAAIVQGGRYRQVPNPFHDLSRTTPVDPNVYFWVSPDRELLIDFPGEPKKVPIPPALRARLGGANAQQSVAMAEGREYTVQIIDFGAAAPDVGKVLQILQDAAAGTDGELVSRETGWDSDRHQRGSVKVRLPGGMMRSLSFGLAGSKAYVATAFYKDDPASRVRVEEFFSSFRMPRRPAIVR
ncbi:DUF805 domain-containing protein [Massilia sp. CCM 8695]|uniref:DUF805 domain-containing protein n=1 Tax=Massilia frigida TaxID=2609281 RepID=A0ABX0N6X4_9BURK|nr:DUF805 domain-containing protein [Massilia frigida]NHZ81151.1 DUF805 domain-containing protein [Massilia frigida]